MGRKRQRTIETQTYEPALSCVALMERAVVRVMVTRGDLTYDDMLDWLVQPGELSLLRAAFPHANLTGGETSKEFDFGGAKASIDCAFFNMRCIPPKRSVMTIQSESSLHHAEFSGMVDQITTIVRQHNKLRKILRYFTDENVTPGAAKHYFPTLQSLLPSNHVFFDVKGDRFKDVHFPHEITECLREAPEIIAKGMLCDPNINGLFRSDVRMLIRLNIDGSQYFPIFEQKTA